MTLAEVIAHIAEHDGCDRRSALKQVRDALGDRRLHIKWDKERIRVSKYILYTHRPPEGASFWKQARIRGAKVFDPETENWRTLLILKNDVFKLWPTPSDLASVATTASESGQATENANVVPVTKAKGGAPSAKEEIYQALDKLSHEKGHSVKDIVPRQRLAELVAKECGKLLGKSRGWTLGTVQDHIRSWPKKH
jgi:hypothetical protein